MKDGNEILDLEFLYKPLIDNLKFFLYCIFFIFCIATFFSFKLTEIYKSEAVISIQDKYKLLYNNSNNSLATGLGILSGESPSYGSSDIKAISILKSRDFFKELFINKNFMLHTFGINYYDKKTKQINFSPDFLDDNLEYDLNKSPEFFEAHTEFLDSFLEVSKDRDSGLILVSIKNQSPKSAKLILEIVINSFVDYLSNREKKMAESSYDFLTKMLDQSNPQVIDRTLLNMLQADIQKIILSNSSDGLIEIIDSPYEPIRKSEPSKLYFIITATLLFSLIIYLVMVVRFLRDPNK